VTVRYLYAVVGTHARVPAVTGIAAAPVEAVRYADLQVLGAELPPSVVAHPDATALWAHETVVEAATETTDAVLPMRFGSTVRDVPRAVALLASRHDDFARGLERVRGRVEVGVRVVQQDGATAPSPGPRSTPASGAAWLRARREARTQVEALAARVHGPLDGLADEHRRAARVTGTTVLATSYLVPRALVDVFRAEAARLDHALPGASVVCTGPWPPYSFTPGDGDDVPASASPPGVRAS
jgi:hypothetical protein